MVGAPGLFAPAAFHCYGGAPSDMGGLPVPAVITECAGTTDGWEGTFRGDATNLVVEAARHGSTGLLLWNLALDPAGGPHTGGCDNCRGLLTMDPPPDNHPSPEFYTLAHLARAAGPGAVRIGSRTSEEVPVVAFWNPDGTIGVFGHNDSGATQVLGIATVGGQQARFVVRADELFTLKGRSEGAARAQ